MMDPLPSQLCLHGPPHYALGAEGEAGLRPVPR